MSIERESVGLLQDMRAGSCAAFAQFYDRYADMVYRMALLRTKDPSEAEDICQDVFLEVLDKPEQYDPSRGSVEAWLAVKTKSRSLDRLRRKQRLRFENWELSGGRPETASTPPEELVLTRMEWDRVRVTLQALPAPQKRALLGAYFEQRTHRELAEELGRPLGTVKTLIRSGLRQLRRSLDGRGVPGGQASGGDGHDA